MNLKKIKINIINDDLKNYNNNIFNFYKIIRSFFNKVA